MPMKDNYTPEIVGLWIGPYTFLAIKKNASLDIQYRRILKLILKDPMGRRYIPKKKINKFIKYKIDQLDINLYAKPVCPYCDNGIVTAEQCVNGHSAICDCRTETITYPCDNCTYINPNEEE